MRTKEIKEEAKMLRKCLKDIELHRIWTVKACSLALSLNLPSFERNNIQKLLVYNREPKLKIVKYDSKTNTNKVFDKKPKSKDWTIGLTEESIKNDLQRIKRTVKL